MKTEFDTNRVLNEIIEKLDPNSHRKQLIDAARAFKSNWIMFGEYLTKIASEKRYLEWGYQSFEEYCKLEIRIKKNTARKNSRYFFIYVIRISIEAGYPCVGIITSFETRVPLKLCHFFVEMINWGYVPEQKQLVLIGSRILR